ncbi:MAG: hypothetical protein EXS59_02540 [Candidatus Taylorbacteria bacterium]|nr:hypothetical protein [Candidatus Taylorbacteria bacterium]
MRSPFTRPVTIIIVIFVVIVLGVLALLIFSGKAPEVAPVAEVKILEPIHKIIGKSVEGRDIDSYTYVSAKADKTATTSLVFVGGIHGGYEWNSVSLAYLFKDYLDANPDVIPKNITVTVIPSANPDGVYKVTGKEGRFVISDVSMDKKVLASGRFNAHEVDLNRNFDCKWQPKSTWQQKTVSAGAKPFSEPESEALRSFILENNPTAVIFWHSQSNGVYASQCEKGILPETLELMNTYAKASGYPAVKSFDAYATTGAAEDWLASISIPAITVELSTHETIEWEMNLEGIKALLKYYEGRT